MNFERLSVNSSKLSSISAATDQVSYQMHCVLFLNSITTTLAWHSITSIFISVPTFLAFIVVRVMNSGDCNTDKNTFDRTSREKLGQLNDILDSDSL